jgi:nucleoside 2-deoxyribosyltransferase
MSQYYISHRLLAAQDRALAAHVARRLARMVDSSGIFLPFCDTDVDRLAADCRGLSLCELDCEQLRQITGMIAILHGPSLDDGVCMEIGFAAALGVPVVIVSTDLQAYAPGPEGPEFSFADPLLDQIAVSVERVHRLGEWQAATGSDRFRAFLDQNLRQADDAATRAVEALLAGVRPSLGVPPPVRRAPRTAFIEPSPYIADGMWADVAAGLRLRGWTVRTAKRFQAGADVIKAAAEDWAAILEADLAVVDARGPEAPPGAALITGACAANGRPVLAAHPGTWLTIAEDREPNWRNLMIQYSVAGRFGDISEFADALDNLSR